MKRLNNNNASIRHYNNNYIIPNLSNSETHPQQTMGNSISTASSVNNFRTFNSFPSNVQKYPNNFLPTTPTLKKSSIVNPIVAQQADRYFGPKIERPAVAVPQSTESPTGIPSFPQAVLSTLSPPSPTTIDTTSRIGLRPSETAAPSVESVNRFSTINAGLKPTSVIQDFNDPEFLRFVASMTTLIFSERYYGDSKANAELTAIPCYSEGEAGKNRYAFQHLASNFDEAQFLQLDITSIISPEIVKNMPEHYYQILKKIPGSKMETVEEILAALDVNPALPSPLILRNQREVLSEIQQANNLSGNSSPDYETHISYLNGKVLFKQEAYYDAKNIAGDLKRFNHVRICDSNTENFILRAHVVLARQLAGIRKSGRSEEITAFQNYLDNNIESFEKTGDLKACIHNYNHAFSLFGPWLVEKKIA